jgi:hypothetical protein
VFRVLVKVMFSNTAQTQWKVIHSVSHSALNVLNILMGIGYIMEWWPHIIRIIYTFLKLHLPECIQPKQRLAPPSPNTRHSPNFSEPSTDSLLLPETCFNFFHDCKFQYRSIASVSSPKGSNLFITACLQPDIKAICSQ